MAQLPQTFPQVAIDECRAWLKSGESQPKEDVLGSAMLVQGYGLHVAYMSDPAIWHDLSRRLNSAKVAAMSNEQMDGALAGANPGYFDWETLIPVATKIQGLTASKG